MVDRHCTRSANHIDDTPCRIAGGSDDIPCCIAIDDIPFCIEIDDIPSASKGATSSEHVPAMLTPAKLHFPPDFCRKHPRLVQKFRSAIAHAGSQWHETCATAPGCTVVGRLRECQTFLQQARRLRPAAGVHVSFCKGVGDIRTNVTLWSSSLQSVACGKGLNSRIVKQPASSAVQMTRRPLLGRARAA
jgi:hypothetical protein